MRRLLVFGSFAHDSHRILAAVYRFALVHVELLLNDPRRILNSEFFSVSNPKLLIATQAHPEVWSWADAFNDPKLAFWHDNSLPPNTCANETAPVPAGALS